MRIFTIGHSTRTIEEFRTTSTRMLSPPELPRDGVEYLWLEKPGGFRHGAYLAITHIFDAKPSQEHISKTSKIKCDERAEARLTIVFRGRTM